VLELISTGVSIETKARRELLIDHLLKFSDEAPPSALLAQQLKYFRA
jgi:hypothetical protein